MSYCRWSSDYYRCDLYIYECGDAEDRRWAIHVAGRRHAIALPPEWDGPNEEAIPHEEWAERYVELHKQLNKAELVPIGLPHDNESFEVTSLEDLLAKVRELRAMGYQCPEGVITDILQEIAEEAPDGTA